MISRRAFLFGSAAAVFCGRKPELTHRERVDLVLAGKEPDRQPFSFWYHFLDENEPGEKHAENTLAFHRKFGTDIVKVMSDYPYPRPEGAWYELEALDNPFPEQIKALEIINRELAGSAHSIETIFNPYKVAEKLSSPEEVARMKDEEPEKLLEALEIITESECNHARKAVAAGVSGVFLAIANADETVLTREEYAKFSEPFDKRIFAAVADAPLNTMHLHGDKVYLDLFYSGWDATVFHYATHSTGVPISEVRRNFGGVIMGGWDYKRILELSDEELRRQWQEARAQAGVKFLLAPGCSAPNESTDEQLRRIAGIVTGQG